MVLHRFRRYCADRAANVGILLALAAVPVVACAGAAMDYIQANQQRTELQARLDTAVLAAVSVSANGKAEGKRRAAAEKLFKENCSSNDCKAKLELTFNGSKVRGTAEFDMPTAFMRVVGINTMPIAATAEAASGGGGLVYRDIYFALDISESMGLAASEEDQKKLASAEPYGCMFACHLDDVTLVNGPGEDTSLEIARRLGTELRLDLMKTEVKGLIDKLQGEYGSNALRFGVYPFSNSAREAIAPTSDVKKAKAAIDSLTLADGLLRKPDMPNQPGDTIFGSVFELLNSKITSQGTGSKADPKKMVIMVTDGTDTIWRPTMTTTAFNPKNCATLQLRKIDIGVIRLVYNFYQGDYGDTYDSYIAPIANEIGPNLKECSSDRFYSEGTSPEEIAKAFDELLGSVTEGTPRLTQ